jgi:isopentenyl-diphosphate delta-isomerase
MGMEVKLEPLLKFTYRAEFENGLIEHEFDHVLVGRSNKLPVLNRDEAMDFEWMSMHSIKKEITHKPQQFTPWFRILIQEHFQAINRYACALQ